MLIKGQEIANIVFDNTLSADGLVGKQFDYMLSNPPFGVEWKKIEKEIRKEAEQQGFNGRFGPGLPRVSDGSLLFLLHLISKMRPAVDGGSRFGIVLNGSPLFTGGAGSGENEIRRYVLENDLVEAIIGLPTDMFYNTGISTYVWIVSNRKPAERKGKAQLIDASSFWQKMRKSLGSKRKELSPEHIEEITRLFGNFEECTRDGVPISRIFRNEEFGYRTITVERPERDAAGKVVLGTKGKGKGKPVPDASLRDTENVPLSENVNAYFEREVLPHAPDAWIDHEKTKTGYEIPFNIAFVASGRYWVNNHAHILKPLDSHLVFWAERLEDIDLTPFITGSAQPKLTIAALENLQIAVPPSDIERGSIQEHIVAEAGRLDVLTAEAQRAINLLQERRTALISAAVTGQIDVRHMAESEIAA